ncbi:MAG TPA: 4Fe-4S binding protein [Chloroflexi bacterium]|jgi:4Fe-4S ferredoxin|nr:4Fe-4S binding protein [Chloroflexota bacterium]
MGRGTTQKTETPQTLTLVRPMITRRYALEVDHEACCGCLICQLVCPREAITLSAAVLEEGRLVEQPRVDIDATTCNFCGECVALCPTHALAMMVNGQPEVPVLKAEAFPVLTRTNVVDAAVCSASTDVAYIDNCPVGAISAELTRDAAGQVTAVENVQVDDATCINCTRCMEEGPKGAFTVTKPYQGRARLNTLLCPDGCQACADVCPTNAITYDGAKVAVDRRFCLFCGACENVCPAEGAIRIARTGFVHAPVESGAWTVALEKLVSYQAAVREYDIKGQAKRRKAVIEGLNLKIEA